MTEPSTDEIRYVVVAWAHAEGYLAVQLPAKHAKRWQVIADACGAMTFRGLLQTSASARGVTAT